MLLRNDEVHVELPMAWFVQIENNLLKDLIEMSQNT